MSFDKIVAHSLTSFCDSHFERIKNMKRRSVGSLYLNNIIVCKDELK